MTLPHRVLNAFGQVRCCLQTSLRCKALRCMCGNLPSHSHAPKLKKCKAVLTLVDLLMSQVPSQNYTNSFSNISSFTLGKAQSGKGQRSSGTVPCKHQELLSSLQKGCTSSNTTQVKMIVTACESCPHFLVISSSCKQVAKSAWRLFIYRKRGNTTVLLESGPILWYFVSEQSKMAQGKVLVN